MGGDPTTIEWPTFLKAKPSMCYESIAPLFHEQVNETTEHLSFAVSCSNQEIEVPNFKGCIHKLDITSEQQTLTNAKIKASHEVLPGQGFCSQIIPVNEKLRVACFNHGSVLPISNFGPKKTFHCDVRGRLEHHTSPVNCIAANTAGTQLASGSTSGEIALYEVNEEKVTFTSRVNVCSSTVTGMSFLKPHQDICMKPNEREIFDGENIVIYSTQNGHIGLLDTRCDLAQRIDYARLMTTVPRLNLTSLCYADSLPGQVVFFGSAHGNLVAIDLRYNNKYLVDQKLPEDGNIRRIKKIKAKVSENETRDYLAYTNETHRIRLMDPNSMEFCESWKCDRKSQGIIKDFCQVGNRIITCGSETSIGSWTYST